MAVPFVYVESGEATFTTLTDTKALTDEQQAHSGDVFVVSLRNGQQFKIINFMDDVPGGNTGYNDFQVGRPLDATSYVNFYTYDMIAGGTFTIAAMDGTPLFTFTNDTGDAIKGNFRIDWDGTNLTVWQDTGDDAGTINDDGNYTGVFDRDDAIFPPGENFAGTAGDDAWTGGVGRDTASGGEGDDLLHGEESGDVLSGGNGRDTLYGGAGNDSLDGGGKNDRLIGNEGDDWITGGNGNDLLLGGQGDDALFGNAGNDELRGGAGNDSLAGGLGDDFLHGGNGRDTLVGGAGSDTLTGGTGADVFRLESNIGVDVITDFDVDLDFFVISNEAYQMGVTGVLDAGRFHLGTEASGADQRLIYDGITGNLYYDADGDGAGSQVLIAFFGNDPELSAGDFTVV